MKCRLCGSEDLVLAYTQGDDGQYHFHRCRSCRLVNYDLEGGTDQEKYSDVAADPADDEARANRGSTRSYAYLSRHVRPPGRFLDIGCGNGRILHLASSDGWQATGLELSPDLARRAEAATGCRVLTLSFLDSAAAEIDGAPFDVVILRHVLEHLPDTRLALGRLRTLLARDGIALLEFPNIDAPGLRVKRWLERAGLRRKRYGPDYVPGHCNEFCREAFAYAARLSGLRLDDWHTYSSRPWLDRLYAAFGWGNKARAVVRKADDAGEGDVKAVDGAA